MPICRNRFVETDTENVDTILLSLSSFRQFFVSDRKGSWFSVYFYPCPALGNFLSVTEKVHDFRYRK